MWIPFAKYELQDYTGPPWVECMYTEGTPYARVLNILEGQSP